MMLMECRNEIEATEKKLKGTAAEGVVSKADLIALAGAYAVRVTGGPTIQVRLWM
jgi:L-ascorbate peroxidase